MHSEFRMGLGEMEPFCGSLPKSCRMEMTLTPMADGLQDFPKPTIARLPLLHAYHFLLASATFAKRVAATSQ